MCVHARFLLSVHGTDTHTPHGIFPCIFSCQAPVVLFSHSTRYIEIEVLAFIRRSRIEDRRQAPIIDFFRSCNLYKIYNLSDCKRLLPSLDHQRALSVDRVTILILAENVPEIFFWFGLRVYFVRFQRCRESTPKSFSATNLRRPPPLRSFPPPIPLIRRRLPTKARQAPN